MNEKYYSYYGSPTRTDFVTYCHSSQKVDIRFSVNYDISTGKIQSVYDLHKRNIDGQYFNEYPGNLSKEKFEEEYNKALEFLKEN